MAKVNKDKSGYNKKKFLLVFCGMMVVFAIIRHAFSIDIPVPPVKVPPVAVLSNDRDEDVTDLQEVSAEMDIDYAETDSATNEVVDEDFGMEDDSVADEVTIDDTPLMPQPNKRTAARLSYDYTEEEEQALLLQLGVSDADSAKLFFPEKYKPMSRVYSYSECFPDINPVQLKAAIANGVQPARSREEAQRYVESGELVNITNSPYYAVDRLTHSIPYLVPKCQQLLNTISVNFIDSLVSKGLPPHIPIVTSVLRTSSDVSKLQKGGNQNATTNSCHCYGTTVDITYARFYPVTGGHKSSRKNVERYNERMKKILAQVLLDLRMQGLCYVKHERLQACFHLTVR